MSATAAASYRMPWTVLDPLTCTALGASTSSPAFTGRLFVKADSSPVIYQVTAGVRRPIQTWATLVRLAGTSRPTSSPSATRP